MKKNLALLAALAMIIQSGVQTSAPISVSKQKLQGTITISGAFALYPMVMKWSEEFRKLHPQVRFDISAGGAGKGIADALANMVDIGMVSREIHPAEIEKGAWFIPVTKDAVVAVINESNPLLGELLKKGAKKADFMHIWLDETPPTWNALVITKGRIQMHVYTRSDSCGAAETWALFLGKHQEDLLGIGVFGDPGLNEAVRKDVLGIGYNNINYAFDATTLKPMPGTVILPIDLNEDGRIDEAEKFYGNRNAVIKAIADNRYPSPPARNLYFVCHGRPQKQLLAAFMQWVLGTGQKYVAEAGYITLPEAKIVQALKKIGL
ncbi:phosphate ABC transporter substrate-binding protein [candidate division KSB1 bacterium]|nr:substrate-binding domain-containing protein [Candidatus Aminicenantes bacterium]RQW03577.1 MAG: phosphate ABC transporter substrate-binding protein [candidate division KSB1 bacterium]